MYETQTETPVLESQELPVYEQSLEMRNDWLQRQIDPDHTLPSVTLSLAEDQGSELYMTIGLLSAPNDSGELTQIGRFSLLVRPPREYRTVSHLTWVKIDESYQGKGYGTSAYLAIMKSLPFGEGMQSDNKLSIDSYRMWRSLEAKGVAVSDRTDEQVQGTFDAGGTKGETEAVTFRTVFGEHDAEALIDRYYQEKTAAFEAALDEKRNGTLMQRMLGKLGLH